MYDVVIKIIIIIINKSNDNNNKKKKKHLPDITIPFVPKTTGAVYTLVYEKFVTSDRRMPTG